MVNKFGKKETNSTSEFYKLPVDCPDKYYTYST